MKRLLLLLALWAPVARAATGGCAGPTSLPEPWTSWRQSGDAVAGGTVGAAPRLILGKPVTAALRPSPQVQFVVKPGKSAARSYGGLFTLAVKQRARIGVALSGGAWVDIATGNTPLHAVAHDHGEPCSGIRKIVWFDVGPGAHIVQLSGADSGTIRIMVADDRANQPTM